MVHCSRMKPARLDPSTAARCAVSTLNLPPPSSRALQPQQPCAGSRRRNCRRFVTTDVGTQKDLFWEVKAGAQAESPSVAWSLKRLVKAINTTPPDHACLIPS